jgi:hypothetical protein
MYETGIGRWRGEEMWIEDARMQLTPDELADFQFQVNGHWVYIFKEANLEFRTVMRLIPGYEELGLLPVLSF